MLADRISLPLQLAAGVLVLALTGCSDTPAPPPTESQNPTPQTLADPTDEAAVPREVYQESQYLGNGAVRLSQTTQPELDPRINTTIGGLNVGASAGLSNLGLRSSLAGLDED